MVIDWKTQIENCIRYTKVLPTFHASILEQKYQQVLIVKKLLSMGYNKLKILAWFKLAEENCVKDEWEIEELIKVAEYRKWPKEHTFRIYITQNEIDYINNLNASKEFKSFLLATVAYCKMVKIKKKRATFNVRERSYIYYLATGKDNYNVGTQRARYIQEFIQKLRSDKIIKLSIRDTKYRLYKPGHRGGSVKTITDILLDASWIEWEAEEGHEVTNLENQMPLLCDKCFKNDTVICERCGKEFLKTSKIKRVLCLACYKEKLKEKRRLEKEDRKCTPWTDTDDERLKYIYTHMKNKKFSTLLKKEFPDRDLKAVYKRANYLGLKKT